MTRKTLRLKAKRNTDSTQVEEVVKDVVHDDHKKRF
jgi:hypothetical protein